MSQVDELINSLSPDDIAAYTANPSEEGHIVVGPDRQITVPEELRRIAVQFDHNIETVTFDCIRYWDGIDMSEMSVYINYLRADGVKGSYLADNVTPDEEDESIMHFDWTISDNVTKAAGNLTFLVCIKNTDENGYEENHWNSELNTQMTISKGLECSEEIVASNPDLIAMLLAENASIKRMIEDLLTDKLSVSEWESDKKDIYDAINNLNDRINESNNNAGSENGSTTTVIGGAGIVGSVTLSTSEWVNKSITKQFTDFEEADGIIFTPATRTDRDAASAADIFVTANNGSVTFTVTDTPTSNISLDYMIVKSKASSSVVEPDNPDTPVDPETPKLSAPILYLRGSYIEIDGVNLTSYDVLVDGVVKDNAVSPEYPLSRLKLSAGTYSISVVAKADGYLNSDPSNIVKYTVAETLSKDVKVGDTFRLGYDTPSSPDTYISNEKVIRVGYVDSDEIEFEAIAPGACVIELRKDLGGGEYVVVSKATVTVYDYVVSVGDDISVNQNPVEFEFIEISPSGILNVYDDGGEWVITAIGTGTCVIYIGNDRDLHDYVYTVKVR